MASWSLEPLRCPVCTVRGGWDTMQHEPWCPNFMRPVDECDGRQLSLVDAESD